MPKQYNYTMKAGAPTKYNTETTIKLGREYLAKCVDEEDEFHSTRGIKSDGFQRIVRVRIPTLEGLALHLKVHKDSIQEWGKKHSDFSVFVDELLAIQANRLIDNGLSGDYNPTIAKVMLSKHGYREATDSNMKVAGVNLSELFSQSQNGK